jgi:GTP cyclohydrolase II
MNRYQVPVLSVRAEVAIPLLTGAKPHFVTFNGFPESFEHFALRFTGQATQDAPLVRVHSECITGDLFGSLRCDCGAQLNEALNLLAIDGGYLLYLRQEGRGIGLYNKLDAYLLQEQGLDTYEANRRLKKPDDARDYGCAAAMLTSMGITRIRLLSSNPAKAQQLAAYGIEIAAVVPTQTFLTPYNQSYLTAKATLTGHSLDLA